MRQRNIGNGFYALRFKILERDGFTCQICGQGAPNVPLEIDHIVPFSEGGEDGEPTFALFAGHVTEEGRA